MSNVAQEILKRELSRRCASNPQFSLRAFARTLGLSPANLSLVLSGKRRASRRTLQKMTDCLELQPADRVRLDQSLSLSQSEPVHDNIDLATLETVCHWMSYAILSLMVTKGFKSDPAWMAKRLGVTIHEVRASLDALSGIGLIVKKGSQWRINRSELRINNHVTTPLTRAFHRQWIGKALTAMEELPMHERDISSITFAMSSEKMTLAKAEIRRFRLRMAEIFEQPGRSEEVYNLSIQLIPTTRSV